MDLIALNSLFANAREVVFRALNDERLTVTEITGSVSCFGYAPEDFLSGETGWRDIVHPDDRTTMRADAESEFRIFDKSGELLWVESVCVAEKDARGRIARFLFKIKDVTKRRRREEELSESMDRLQKSESIFYTLFDNSEDGVLLADKDGVIVDCSCGCEHMSGLPKDMLVGRPLWDLAASIYHGHDSDEARMKTETEIRQSISGAIRKTFTRHAVNRATGKSIMLNTRYFPLPQPDGMMWGIILHDVTELMRSWDLILQNEQKISAEESRLKTIGDNIPDSSLFRFARNQNTDKYYMEYVSASWEKVTGFSPESLVADMTPIFAAVHPDDAEYLNSSMALSKSMHTDFNVEVRVVGSNYSVTWLHFASSPHEMGDKIVWDGIVRNITERKNIEQELGKIRRRQTILIKVLQIVQNARSLPEALNLSLAEMGRYMEVSRVYIFEKSDDGTIINNTYEWCNEGIRPAIEHLQNLDTTFLKPWFDVFAAGGYICTSDINTLTPEIAKDLSAYEIKSIVALPLTSGGIHHGFVGFDECTSNREWDRVEVELLKSLSQIVTTTTRRHQAENVIRLSRQTMRTVLDNVGSMIFVADMDTSVILFANKKLRERLGEVEEKICWQALQSDQTGVCEFCPRKHISRKEPSAHPYRWEFSKPDGRWFESFSVSIRWIDGRIVQLEDTIEITDRKISEMELIHAKEKAEESEKLKSSFLANFSHEIRTPLNAITGFLNFVHSEGLTPDARQEYINLINLNTSKLLKLIDYIIDFARIESGQMTMQPVPLKINSLMQDLQTFYESYMNAHQKKHIHLLLDDSGFIDSCVICVDTTRLRHVLDNLLDNAIKFTEKGYICFGYRQSTPDMLEFSIGDTGIGMSQNQFDIIFESFRQAELHNARLYGGTGLGLALARGLVRLMGGDLWVESTKGEGSTFYFTIPYVAEASSG